MMESGCSASCLHRELSRAEGINVETDIATCKSALLLKDPPQALVDCHVASEESTAFLASRISKLIVGLLGIARAKPWLKHQRKNAIVHACARMASPKSGAAEYKPMRSSHATLTSTLSSAHRRLWR